MKTVVTSSLSTVGVTDYYVSLDFDHEPPISAIIIFFTFVFGFLGF